MSYLSPDTAPSVHIEQLPITAVAADVSLDTTNAVPRLSITTWASGDDIPCVANPEGTSSEDFVEYTCCDCEYHTDEMEHSSDGQVVYVGGEEMELAGTFYTYSPCPCYSDGLGEVSFPCSAGHDGPDYDEDRGEDVNLSAKYLRLTNLLYVYGTSAVPSSERIFIQRSAVNDDGVVLTSPQKYSAINCYDDGRVCWGDNDPGNTLAEILIVYTESEANEDLTSADSHAQGIYSCERVEPNTERPTAVPLSPYDHRGKAIVTATALCNPVAFLIMTAAGCKTNGSVAYIPVYLYPSVAVDDDTIVNVWATDVLSTDTRLLFYQNEDPECYNGQFIGQVPSNFDLTPCNSRLPQSSEQAELVSS